MRSMLTHKGSLGGEDSGERWVWDSRLGPECPIGLQTLPVNESSHC